MDLVHPLACRVVQPWLSTRWADSAATGGGDEHGVTAEHPQEDLLTASHSESSPSAWDEADGRWGSGASCYFAGGRTGKEGPQLGSWPRHHWQPLGTPRELPRYPELWEPDGLVRVYLQEGILNPGSVTCLPLPVAPFFLVHSSLS